MAQLYSLEILQSFSESLRVQAAAVTKIPDEITAPGAIEPDPTRYARLALPGPGRVSRLLVHAGEQVKQGQTLALIDSPDVDTARAGYIQAEANLVVAKANLYEKLRVMTLVPMICLTTTP